MAERLKQAAPPRPGAPDVARAVAEMLERIDSEGVEAIREYSRKLDGWDPPSFRVGEAEIEAAAVLLSAELRGHIESAQTQIRLFAEAQRATLAELEMQPQPGVTLGHKHIPVGAVGAYVPSGRYPMLASAFMTVLVPKVAGVPRVVGVAAPWQKQGVHPAVLYAIATSGADEIYCIGGVQALAMLAFGTDEVGPVDMIVGAGNAYVAEAKRQLFGRVGIDLLAGPTEVLVIADGTANADLVAADLLGQAEHGPTSPAVLISLSHSLASGVMDRISHMLAQNPDGAAALAWRDHGQVIVVDSAAEAIELADQLAYEHVEVQVDESALDDYLDGLRNYGSLFLGEEATVVYGDKAIGTNHVLPTARAARYTGGLWVGKFLKTVTYQRVTSEGTASVAPVAAAISEAELFAGHALTARMRLDGRRSNAIAHNADGHGA